MSCPSSRPISVPDRVCPEEELGRALFGIRNKTKKFRTHDFLQKGINTISVDRLTYAPLSDITIIADERATHRQPVRPFAGWAVITAKDAAKCARQVVASPTSNPPNPYHADIVLPESNKDQDAENRI